MGKQGKLSEDEIRFAKARFFRYYSKAKIEPPPRVALREWGFFLFGGDRMHRPVTFMGQEEMTDYLFRKVPRHAYYSTAYYRNPEMPMESPEKGWMGADLIFDLDADGLPGAEKLSYEEQLSAVKKEIIRLYDVFLQEHLGFSDREMELVFSGGRGYHIHIRSPAVLDLNSDERRQIMDYVAGTFRDFREILPVRKVRGYRATKEIPIIPMEGGGWHSLVRRAAFSLVDDIESSGKEGCVDVLRGEKVRIDIAERTCERLFIDSRYRKIRESGDLSMFMSGSPEERGFLKAVENRMRRMFAVHPDVHVTPDIRRLIRLPGSLHGGTGFMVMEIKRDELDDFLPTRDAVPDIYGDEKVGVFTDKTVKVAIKGEEHRIKGSSEIPEEVAMFLLLSGRASLSEKI